MEPRLGLKLPKTGGTPSWSYGASAGEWGVRAEELGYDSLWTSEGWGAHAFVDLAEAAVRTETLRLGTAIANVYSRSPAVLAMAGASLARLSDGRAVLGVGASHPGLVEDLHAAEYRRPVRRTHEAIELVAAFTRGGDRVDYDGEVFSVAGFPPLDEPVPVYNAALGAANRRATGRVADGWIPYLLPFSRLDGAFETVAAAARGADRRPDDVDVVPQVLAAVADDAGAARRPIREYVARYVGNFEAYESAIAEAFPEETAAVADAWRAGDREAARDRVTDEMVGEFGVAGPPERAREQLRDVLALDAVDAAIVYVPDGTRREVLDRTVEALAPERVA